MRKRVLAGDYVFGRKLRLQHRVGLQWLLQQQHQVRAVWEPVYLLVWERRRGLRGLSKHRADMREHLERRRVPVPAQPGLHTGHHAMPGQRGVCDLRLVRPMGHDDDELPGVG